MFKSYRKSPSLDDKKIKYLFALLTFWVILQLSWWVWVFLQNNNSIAQLKFATAKTLYPTLTGVERTQIILEEHAKQKIMFLSESIFFVGMSLLAIFLLFKTIRSEAKNRRHQKLHGDDFA